ncbi:DUF427 domain-containing protein [Streptomyces sp. NPDC001443]
MVTFRTAQAVRTTPEGLLWEPSERWVRGRKGEVTVVDSRRPVLVWEPGLHVPQYAFPRAEVRTDLLRTARNPPVPPEPGTPDPSLAPGAHAGSRIFYDLEVGGELLENAAWTYPAADLAGHIAFEWSTRSGRGLDRWFEEEEEIFVHPRDPHKRVDALPSSRHVVVEIEGTVVADSHRPVLLFETGLPVRHYLPREDVRLDLFDATGHSTGCPYKGTARYWSWRAGGAVPQNVLWSYPEPLPAVAAVAGLLAFFDEAVDTTVDGERLERPVTPFTAALGTPPAR